jgi:phage tail-like protein
MPVPNPVPAFDFTVFMFDANPVSSSGLSNLAGAGAALSNSALFASFAEVNGLNAEMETEEYRAGGRNTGPHKFVKWGRYPNLVFKRGVTFNSDIWDWYYTALYNPNEPVRRNGVIALMDRGGGSSAIGGSSTPFALPSIERLPVAVWFFRDALPEKLQGPQLNAKSNEIAIETLEIVHEGLYRCGPAMIPGILDNPSATIGL